MIECEKPSIVHTDISGNRWVDFKFLSGLMHVILAFHPEHSVDITQGIGRGNRNLKDEASSTLLLDRDDKMLKLLMKSPYHSLVQREKLNKVKDQKTTKLLIKLRSTALDKVSKKALDFQDRI